MDDEYKAAFEAMRASEMNNWVGGADPELVGELCSDILARHLTIMPGAHLLDFGCGVGRVGLSVLRRNPLLGGLTGIDIVPKMVDFCRAEIGARFPQATFELLTDANEHYDRFKHTASARSRSELTSAYGVGMDGAFAFSVFTHVAPEDFVPLLRFVGDLLKPGARFMFTAFILTPYARAMIKARATRASFPEPVFRNGDEVFIGTKSDRLAFIAYDIGRIEAMVWEAGLVPCALEYGDWRGGPSAGGYQDVVLCAKPET